jgi:hypothetical protein
MRFPKPDGQLIESWLKSLFAFVIGSLPLLLHFLALCYLPAFHREVRATLNYVWTYHIADSGVTVGLAYYLVMAFFLWQTRWLSWRGANMIWDEFDLFGANSVPHATGVAVRNLPGAEEVGS